jgi:chromosome partitioning protein
MKSIITVTNQKGGIGKTTTAHAIGAGYSLKGYRVLLIDLDPQSNLTMATGTTKRPNKSTYELLTSNTTAREIIQPIRENIAIMPASNNLSKITIELNETGKEYRLKEKLEPIINEYDYFIIDTPPALTVLTINALTIANRLVIPAQADLFSLEAVKELADTIGVIKKYTSPALAVEGVLLTRYQPRSILTKELTDLIDETASTLKTKVFNTKIREAIAIKEAQAMHQDIFTYAPKSKVAGDYRAFFKELTESEDI